MVEGTQMLLEIHLALIVVVELAGCRLEHKWVILYLSLWVCIETVCAAHAVDLFARPCCLNHLMWTHDWPVAELTIYKEDFATLFFVYVIFFARLQPRTCFHLLRHDSIIFHFLMAEFAGARLRIKIIHSSHVTRIFDVCLDFFSCAVWSAAKSKQQLRENIQSGLIEKLATDLGPGC